MALSFGIFEGQDVIDALLCEMLVRGGSGFRFFRAGPFHDEGQRHQEQYEKAKHPKRFAKPSTFACRSTCAESCASARCEASLALAPMAMKFCVMALSCRSKNGIGVVGVRGECGAVNLTLAGDERC